MTGDMVFRLSLACPAQPLGEAGSGGHVAHHDTFFTLMDDWIADLVEYDDIMHDQYHARVGAVIDLSGLIQ
jgi:hypothetical protein